MHNGDWMQAYVWAKSELDSTKQERDQLRAELEKVRCELDDAEERASEAEERCAAEWEKDCGQALRILAQVTKFEWDQDGSPEDEVREHIQITIESLEKQLLSLRAELARLQAKLSAAENAEDVKNGAISNLTAELAAAKEERDQLAAHVERLVGALKEITKKAATIHFRMSGRDLDAEGYVALDSLRLIGVRADTALAATPAQSLAAHDAALLRKVAEKLRNEESANSSLHAEFVEAEAIQIKAEADRIAKEAANGKA